jgi:hypothetical protein
MTNEQKTYSYITQTIMIWIGIYKKSNYILPTCIPMEVNYKGLYLNEDRDNTPTEKYEIIIGDNELVFGTTVEVDDAHKEIGQQDVNLDKLEKVIKESVSESTRQELTQYIKDIFERTKDKIKTYVYENQ